MPQETGESARRARLDAARRTLLEQRLRGEALAGERANAIQARSRDAPARASYAQSRLWFLDRLYDATPAYHMYRALRLRGRLDGSALRRALDGLVERHSGLRTAFAARDGELYQEIAPPCAMPLTVERLEHGADPETVLARRLPEEVARPFDLSRPPLIRAVLFELAPDEQVLLLVTHHIVSDEWSDELLAEELAERYRATVAGRELSLPELPVSYADYAEWQRERVERIREAQLDYWRSQLAGELSPLDLPFDHPRPPRPSLRGGLLRRTVPAALGGAVEELTRTAGVTPFILLLSAFKVLLHRYSGQDDIVVGVPAANRSAPEVEGLVGLFLNTLVLRSRPVGERRFVDYLGEVRQVALAAYEHQELPLELVVAELQPERDLSRNPLFQVMFVHSSDASARLDFGAAQSSEMHLDPGVAKFDLTLFTAWRGKELEVLAEYSSDLFDASTVESLLSAFEVLLAGIVNDPKGRLDSLPLLAERDRAELIATLTGPDPAPGRDPTWLHAFAAAIERQPDAPALVDTGGRISYAELDRRAAAVARALRSAGVTAGDFVGVYMERSTDQIVSILGVLKSGAAYVPLDPAYPRPRIAAILAELGRAGAGRQRVLVRRAAAPELPADVLPVIIEDVGDTPAGDPPDLPQPGDPAYAMFTSGSTGTPKGVVVSHANLAHSNAARTEYYTAPVERYLLLSSFAFDSSVAGIFWTLGSGGALILGPPGFERDPRLVSQLIAQHAVTHTLMLPALYELVLDAAPAGALDSLRAVIVAGEACSVRVAEQHASTVRGAALYNEYGPTEASVWATVYECTGHERDSVPIGRPIPGMRASILDARLELVPKGAAGELCLAGLGVSAGYLGRPELSGERFVPDPIGEEGALYRTGDRARLHGGELRYLGRVDEQIKVRGYRVEPAEIVASMQSRPDVVEAAVVAEGGTARAEKLIAYVVPRDGHELDIRALRQGLKASLPDYMVPSLFVTLSELPRMPNGKLDTAALPPVEAAAQPDTGAEAGAYEGDEVLGQIMAIWRRVLGRDVGPEDDFFDAGGHSLLGVSLIMSIERELGVELPLATLFEAPTPAGVAERVRSSRAHSRFRYVIPIQPQGSKPPIFCIHGGARLLARHLGDDQPVYLLFHDIGEADAELESVEKVAGAYLEEMRRVQPHGPYYLCGFSYGGMLTYEIAIRLHRAGERIGLFVLLDPPPLINTSLLKLQLEHKVAEMKGSGSRLGFIARELPLLVLRRLRKLWRESQWAYYRTAARSRLMYGAGAAIALLGFAAVAITGLRMSVEDWRPLSEPLPMEQGRALETQFVPGRSGLHEVELAVNRALPRSALERTALAYKNRSELDVEWSIWRGEARVAAGDATEYHYLDLTPRTFPGKVGYVLFQLPMSRDAAHRRSFGLAGSFTWARGLGAVELEAGTTYTLRARVGRAFPELAVTDPHIDVRVDRRRFLQQRAEVLVQGYSGLALVVLGLLVVATALLRKRQTVPPELIAYRNLQHNLRLSRRYEYPPYPGGAVLYLPERHEDTIRNTVSSWRSVIQGRLQVDIIEGARRHLDLIDEEHGSELARRFGGELAAARGDGTPVRTPAEASVS